MISFSRRIVCGHGIEWYLWPTKMNFVTKESQGLTSGLLKNSTSSHCIGLRLRLQLGKNGGYLIESFQL